MAKINEVKIEVGDTTVEERKAQKQRVKEEKRAEAYAKSMITRIEAFNMSKKVAVEEVSALADFMREPLRANLVQTMAVVDLLIAKEIFTKEEFEASMNGVLDKLQQEEEAKNAEGQQEGDC